MKSLKITIPLLCLLWCTSCSMLFSGPRKAACIQNDLDTYVIITARPVFNSQSMHYWEKYMQCPVKDTVYKTDGYTLKFDSLHKDCIMKIDDEKVYMQYIIEDEIAGYGTYFVAPGSIFHLANPRLNHHSKYMPVTADDLWPSYLHIVIPQKDTIVLTGRQAIFDFLQSEKYKFNKQVDRKLNRNYKTIAVLK